MFGVRIGSTATIPANHPQDRVIFITSTPLRALI
jgi:hypothetical protein